MHPRLSSVAGEKLRNNNPGIADLSDENRPINLGEKFSQLYDDQWTDAIEHLEEMGYTETDGIRCLLDILKVYGKDKVSLALIVLILLIITDIVIIFNSLNEIIA